ncbi:MULTISPECIES: MraY family glycosyltransferase [Pseudomonas]|uniref:Glycosyltransferase family 4 protein n=1 Tax=Pseudomonas aegrilactucae TaxID=2854028 RepID=A0A9Q2XFL4_9PSED|nr:MULTISPECIES: glycosyltransferase family 4 protein [Pseudomonas]MBV6285936.1 glycosyltransferase family 4 protein [Pseudomonas aegrilactucae]MEC6745473.1 glycosyltransferase family 4 protein [Pseudomonas qingdaonensis]
MSAWWLCLVVLVSLVLTAGLRRYAMARSLIDVPNMRSSHSVPTPRGGGVSIVLSFLLSLAVLAVFGSEDPSVLIALGGAGALIAILGFMDDHDLVSVRWRLVAHFVAAGWLLGWLGGIPPLVVFGLPLDLGWIGVLLGVFYLVWMLNLYNFMDGIDGIASVEAITVCLGMCLLYMLGGATHLSVLALLLSMSVAGFLYWNFPPARIFMGDAGSGFLGIILGGMSLQAAWSSQQFFWCWLIMLGGFIVDATFTLLRRLCRGDTVYVAHRSHAYQFAAREYGQHLPVTLAMAGLNVCWLLPVAVCVVLLDLDGALGVLIAYVPLVALALRYRAGALE